MRISDLKSLSQFFGKIIYVQYIMPSGRAAGDGSGGGRAVARGRAFIIHFSTTK
jgi:hypothetical protein